MIPIGAEGATSAGGGISTTAGSVTITDSVISFNQVNFTGTALGGGIDCEYSVLSLTNCTVNGLLRSDLVISYYGHGSKTPVFG
jgi:hypothetical protein